MAKKIAIASSKGGVGKSMLASSLAILLSKEYTIKTLDCDVDAPNLAIWLGNPRREIIEKLKLSRVPVFDYDKCDGCGTCAKKCRFGAIKMEKGKPVLNPFLCEGCGTCEIVCPKNAIRLKKKENGALFLAKTKFGFNVFGGNLLPGETGSGKIVEKIKERAKSQRADISIIDTSPGVGCPVISAVKDVDLAIIITEPGISAFSDIRRTIEIMDYFNINWYIVINKAGINPKMEKKIKKWSKARYLGGISYDKNIFREVSLFRTPVEVNLPAGEEIEKIYKKIKKVW